MPPPTRSPGLAAAAVAAVVVCCCSLTATGEGTALPGASSAVASVPSPGESGTGTAPAARALLEPAAETRYGGLPPPAPGSSAGRVAGAVATWVLVAAAALTLAMRLSVGWPRFPPRYRGRRRTRP
ncbi:hypothetical protein [Actinorugispora endophytica]|uniref:MYXO-CTERM domain-containing protein n=1 Tax=Actinorugispora endophytica TaxID=1605990 RepID=A0A4R6VE87_9ACTN|nr:hypothetical protein [Actinorugispora endophytica]TDQ55357.1 hypothetical protein EV190_101683 [Actinorugispora endophytica]